MQYHRCLFTPCVIKTPCWNIINNKVKILKTSKKWKTIWHIKMGFIHRSERHIRAYKRVWRAHMSTEIQSHSNISSQPHSDYLWSRWRQMTSFCVCRCCCYLMNCGVDWEKRLQNRSPVRHTETTHTHTYARIQLEVEPTTDEEKKNNNSIFIIEA